MPKENVVEITTGHIQTFIKIFEMLEGVSSDEVNILLKKSNAKNNKLDSEKSDDSDESDESETNTDVDLDSNSDSDSDTKSKKKDKKKKDKKQNKKENKKDKKKKDKKDKNGKKENTDKGGMVIKTMNNHQTTISMIKLDVEMFDHFYVKDEEFSFWLDIKELNNFLKCIKCENHTLKMCIEDEDKAVKFYIKHNDKEDKYKSYAQSFIESDTKIDKIEKPDFDYVILMNSQLFKKICTDMKKFSDYVEIKCNSERIIFQCLTKYNRLNIDSYENDEDDVEIKQLNKNNKETKVSFYLDYLLKLKYSAAICDNILIHLGNKTPLFINSDITSGDFVCGKMLVYFSPHDAKIENENYHDMTKDLYEEKKANIKD
jgi:proliferating cell nuclear antigen PCNA